MHSGVADREALLSAFCQGLEENRSLQKLYLYDPEGKGFGLLFDRLGSLRSLRCLVIAADTEPRKPNISRDSTRIPVCGSSVITGEEMVLGTCSQKRFTIF